MVLGAEVSLAIGYLKGFFSILNIKIENVQGITTDLSFLS